MPVRDFKYFEASMRRALVYCDPETMLHFDGLVYSLFDGATEGSIQAIAMIIAKDAKKNQSRRGAELREILKGGLLPRLKMEASFARNSTKLDN